jgi:hypothetical protein
MDHSALTISEHHSTQGREVACERAARPTYAFQLLQGELCEESGTGTIC